MKQVRIFIAIFSLIMVHVVASAQTTKPVLAAYYGMKDALVASDGAKAKAKATDLLKALDGVNASKLSVAGKKALHAVDTLAFAICKSSANLETQRTRFKALSENMITLTKATKPAKAYVQYCPMVKASWLSDKKQIANPYYGNKMLTCGTVKEEI